MYSEIKELWENSYKKLVTNYFLTKCEACEMIANQLNICESIVKKSIFNIKA